ncbi:hypothetical protein ACFL02_02370 [Planctomycetota bacterium]
MVAYTVRRRHEKCIDPDYCISRYSLDATSYRSNTTSNMVFRHCEFAAIAGVIGGTSRMADSPSMD